MQPGEKKTVTLLLTRRDFSWYNAEQRRWEADNGQYEIAVGSSSRDLRLKTKLTLTIGTTPSHKVTTETYVGDLMKMKSLRIKQALKEAGLLDMIEKALASQEGRAIFANIPLRALTMTGVKYSQIEQFLEKVN